MGASGPARVQGGAFGSPSRPPTHTADVAGEGGGVPALCPAFPAGVLGAGVLAGVARVLNGSSKLHKLDDFRLCHVGVGSCWGSYSVGAVPRPMVVLTAVAAVGDKVGCIGTFASRLGVAGCKVVETRQRQSSVGKSFSSKRGRGWVGWAD